MTSDPHQMPAGLQDGLGDREDAASVSASGTDSGEEGDDKELASYSRIHGLAQPWSSEQPGPSRQRRLWDASRSHATSAVGTARTSLPHHAQDGFAASVPAKGSGTEGAASRDRASVSWDVPPTAPDPAADVERSERLSWQDQPNGHSHAADARWDSVDTCAAPRFDPHRDDSGRYSQPHYDAHAGTSWPPHGDLRPARSVSPSQVHSRQHAELAEPSNRRAWAPHSSTLADDIAGSQQQADAAETGASGEQHSASGQHGDGESRTYWRRFAADTAPQGAAACNNDSWDQAHDERAGHGHMPTNIPRTTAQERVHGTVRSAAARRADGRGSSPDARRKVRSLCWCPNVLATRAGGSAVSCCAGAA